MAKAAKIKNSESINDVPFTEAEVMELEPQVDKDAKAIVLKDKVIEKYDVCPKKKIAELSAKYMPLKVANLQDEDGYELVKSAYTETRSLRGKIEDQRKLLKADALAYGRAVDAAAAELTEKIRAIEDYLYSQKKPFEDEREREKAEKRRLAQEKMTNRIGLLLSLGMVLNTETNEYQFEGWALNVINVQTLPDDRFNEFVSPIKVRVAFLKQEAEEKKKRDAELVIQLEKQKLEQEENQRLLDEKNRKLQADLSKLLKMRTEARTKLLEGLGMQFILSKQRFEYGNIFLSIGEVETIEEDAIWEEKVENIISAIDKEKKRIADFYEKETQIEKFKVREKERLTEITALGLFWSEPNQSFVYKDVNIAMVEVKTLEDDQWKILVDQVKPIMEEYKKQEKQAELMQQRFSVRSRQIAALGFQDDDTSGFFHPLLPTGISYTSLRQQPDEEWQSDFSSVVESLDKAKADKIKKETEQRLENERKERELRIAEENAAMSDSERWGGYIDSLVTLSKNSPILESKKYKTKLLSFQGDFEQFILKYKK
jgi:hypothetical protein